MGNQKVYLAKSNGASGSDVEYVRSNLLRIPGLELVEYSSGIAANECEYIVVIAETQELDGDSRIIVSKNVGTVIEDFLQSEDGYLDNVLAYVTQGNSSQMDVEKTTPVVMDLNDFELGEDETNSYLTLNTDVKYSLLASINSNYDWIRVTRYPVAKDIYSIPPIPDFETRRCSRVKTRDNETEECASQNYTRSAKVTSSSNSDSTVKIRARKRRL